MWDKIKDYLTNEECKELNEAIQFIRTKTAKDDARLREMSSDWIEVMRSYDLDSKHNNCDALSIINRACLYAMDSEWTLAYQSIIGNFLGYCRGIEIKRQISLEQYNKAKVVTMSDVNDMLRQERYFTAFKMMLYVNETKYILKNGAELCFDNPDDDHYKFINLKNAGDDDRIFESALFFLTIGLYDRARPFIDALMNFRKQPYVGAKRGAYFIRLYDKMTDYLDNLYYARLSDDQEISKRYASKAILANIIAVVDNYGDDEAFYFMCEDIVPSMALLVEFDYDEVWSDQFLRVSLPMLNNWSNVNAFRKAQEKNIWLDSPEKYGMGTFDDIHMISDQLRKELRQSTREE